MGGAEGRLSGGLRARPVARRLKEFLSSPPDRGGTANPVGFADVAALILALAGAAGPGPAHTTRDKHV